MEVEVEVEVEVETVGWHMEELDTGISTAHSIAHPSHFGIRSTLSLCHFCFVEMF